MRKFAPYALALALAAAPAFAADVFDIDKSHSDFSFSVRHLVSKSGGRFDNFSGKINLDAANLEGSSVEIEIDVASINTSNTDRDNHLKSPDFFDVAKFPKITFKSSKIKKSGAETFDVTGSFSMHGVTKEITLPVTYLGSAKDPWGNTRAGFSTALTLNRKDYGVNWNKTLDQGGLILGEDVAITINIEAIQAKPKA